MDEDVVDTPEDIQSAIDHIDGDSGALDGFLPEPTESQKEDSE